MPHSLPPNPMQKSKSTRKPLRGRSATEATMVVLMRHAARRGPHPLKEPADPVQMQMKRARERKKQKDPRGSMILNKNKTKTLLKDAKRIRKKVQETK
jgi:hypothetical protein